MMDDPLSNWVNHQQDYYLKVEKDESGQEKLTARKRFNFKDLFSKEAWENLLDLAKNKDSYKYSNIVRHVAEHQEQYASTSSKVLQAVKNINDNLDPERKRENTPFVTKLGKLVTFVEVKEAIDQKFQGTPYPITFGDENEGWQVILDGERLTLNQELLTQQQLKLLYTFLEKGKLSEEESIAFRISCKNSACTLLDPNTSVPDIGASLAFSLSSLAGNSLKREGKLSSKNDMPPGIQAIYQTDGAIHIWCSNLAKDSKAVAKLKYVAKELGAEFVEKKNMITIKQGQLHELCDACGLLEAYEQHQLYNEIEELFAHIYGQMNDKNLQSASLNRLKITNSDKTLSFDNPELSFDKSTKKLELNQKLWNKELLAPTKSVLENISILLSLDEIPPEDSQLQSSLFSLYCSIPACLPTKEIYQKENKRLDLEKSIAASCAILAGVRTKEDTDPQKYPLVARQPSGEIQIDLSSLAEEDQNKMKEIESRFNGTKQGSIITVPPASQELVLKTLPQKYPLVTRQDSGEIKIDLSLLAEEDQNKMKGIESLFNGTKQGSIITIPPASQELVLKTLGLHAAFKKEETIALLTSLEFLSPESLSLESTSSQFCKLEKSEEKIAVVDVNTRGFSIEYDLKEMKLSINGNAHPTLKELLAAESLLTELKNKTISTLHLLELRKFSNYRPSLWVEPTPGKKDMPSSIAKSMYCLSGITSETDALSKDILMVIEEDGNYTLSISKPASPQETKALQETLRFLGATIWRDGKWRVGKTTSKLFLDQLGLLAAPPPPALPLPSAGPDPMKKETENLKNKLINQLKLVETELGIKERNNYFNQLMQNKQVTELQLKKAKEDLKSRLENITKLKKQISEYGNDIRNLNTQLEKAHLKKDLNKLLADVEQSKEQIVVWRKTLNELAVPIKETKDIIAELGSDDYLTQMSKASQDLKKTLALALMKKVSTLPPSKLLEALENGGETTHHRALKDIWKSLLDNPLKLFRVKEEKLEGIQELEKAAAAKAEKTKATESQFTSELEALVKIKGYDDSQKEKYLRNRPAVGIEYSHIKKDLDDYLKKNTTSSEERKEKLNSPKKVIDEYRKYEQATLKENILNEVFQYELPRDEIATLISSDLDGTYQKVCRTFAVLSDNAGPAYQEFIKINLSSEYAQDLEEKTPTPLRDRVTAQVEEVEKAKQKLDQENKKLDQLTTEIKELESVLKPLEESEKEYINLEKTLETLTSTLTSKKIEIEEQQNKLEKITNQLTQELEGINTSITEDQQKIRDLKQKLAVEKSEKITNQLTQELERINTSIAEDQQKIRDLKQKLAVEKSEEITNQLNQELERINTSITEGQQKITDLKQKLAVEKFEEKKVEQKNLITQLESQQTQVKQTTSDLESKQKSLESINQEINELFEKIQTEMKQESQKPEKVAQSYYKKRLEVPATFSPPTERTKLIPHGIPQADLSTLLDLLMTKESLPDDFHLYLNPQKIKIPSTLLLQQISEKLLESPEKGKEVFSKFPVMVQLWLIEQMAQKQDKALMSPFMNLLIEHIVNKFKSPENKDHLEARKLYAYLSTNQAATNKWKNTYEALLTQIQAQLHKEKLFHYVRE